MQVIISGTIQADGKLVLDRENVELPPGRVTITINTEGFGSSLEEIKAWMQNPPELTPERKKALDELYDRQDKIAQETGLPDDFADNLDNYLYSYDEEP